MTTLVSYQPAFDEAVEVIGVSITVLDITDWKRVKRRWQARPAPALAFVSSNPALPNLPVGGSCR
jgi:hypothetical protein